MRFVKWGAAIILVAAIVISLWLANSGHQMQEQRTALLMEPTPAPAWIMTYAPMAAQTLSVKEAVFGISDDPFWPGAGIICVQIDSSVTHITSLDALKSRLTLSLNDEPIREKDSGQLRLGTRDIKGFIFPSFAKRIPGMNMCWRLILEPGEYLATLRLLQDSGTALEYEWAFRLTE